MKNYKDCSPIETIIKIRTILNQLGILLKEDNDSNDTFPSCRIVIGNNGVGPLNIGSNGKGITYEYSLASAYAEFMERLQNRMYFKKKKYATNFFIDSLPSDSLYVSKLKQNGLNFEFVYDLEEENWDVDKVVTENNKILSDILNIENKVEIKRFIKEELNYEKLLMIPFYSINRQEEKLLPIELIFAGCGSTGMCAGNSFHEAMLQGLCEIFERFAGRKMYFESITPPTIPLETFNHTTIHDKIEKLIEDTGYKVIIKDCSLGLGLPVLGVLIIDQQKQKYNFNLGADFVPEIALERCLTEIHQGVNDVAWLPLVLTDSSMHKSELTKMEYIYFNGDKIFVNSSGFWPIELFSSRNSYEFTGFNLEFGESNEKDLNFGIKLVNDFGFEIFIRDNSITGFPSYYVFVPGMSQFPQITNHYTLISSSFSKINLINKINLLNDQEVLELASALDENYNIIKFIAHDYTSAYLYNTDKDLIDLDIELLLFMLYYKSKQTVNAKKYLDIYLKDKDILSHSYYFAISDFIHLYYVVSNDIDVVRNILSLKYGNEEAEEVISDLKNPSDVLSYYNFPSCFNCETCKVSKTCHLIDVYKMEKELDKLHCSNYIDQKTLKQYFPNLNIKE